MPLCRFHMAGSCRYGATCRNSHQQSVCSYFAAGNCRRGNNCDFLHVKTDKGFKEKKVNRPEYRSVHNTDLPDTSGFRYDRVQSCHDNLSNKFRFSVPSPTPYKDQIFYSSDSDWDVEPNERLPSCTLTLYTCTHCQEKILGQEGDEQNICSGCEEKECQPVRTEALVEEVESVIVATENKMKVKKKKRKKKKSQCPVPASVLESDVYQTPEGVKVYRAQEELLKEGKCVEEVTSKTGGLNVESVESCTEDDNEPFLNMNEDETQASRSDPVVKPVIKDKNESTIPKSQTAGKNSQKYKSSDVKTTPKIRKPRNKSHRRRARRQYRNQERPQSVQKENNDCYQSADSISDSLLTFLVSCDDILKAFFSHCLPIVFWLLNLLLEMVFLSLAIIFFILRVAFIFIVGIIHNSYHFPSKLINSFCYYLFHPVVKRLPIRFWSFLFHSSLSNWGRVAYIVPVLELDRCKNRKSSESFRVGKSLIFDTEGMEYLEVEKYFSEALEAEPSNPEIISGRAKARFKQNKLCLALEDLARIERTTKEDLLLGAHCYFGLGMLNRANDILKFLESKECVNTSEFLELKKNIIREECLLELPYHSQVEKLRMLVKQQSPCNIRYKIRLAEQMCDRDMLKDLVSEMGQFMNENVGKGEQEAYFTYLSGLVEYYSGNLARAEKLLLDCQPPCKVSRCRYMAQLATNAREKLDLADHCLKWGKIEDAEKLYYEAAEIDLNNTALEYMSRLGVSKCLFAKGDFTSSLVICEDLLECQVEEEIMVQLMVLKAEILFNLRRYQDVIKLVLNVPKYVENSDLVSLLDRARKELDKTKLNKVDGLNYYDMLGVESDADEAEIKAAYKKLAKENHPDKFVDKVMKVNQEEIMKEINLAYNTLCDNESRARYDITLNSEGNESLDEELVKVFHEFLGEVYNAANDWIQKQERKGKKVTENSLNGYISDYLINNREYFKLKYNIHGDALRGFIQSLKSGGVGVGGGRGKRRR